VSGRKLILTSLLALLVMAPAAQATPRHGLLTGFSDFQAFQGPSPAERQAAFANLRAARGTVLRIQSGWNEIAPTKPPTDADARDPAWPGYRWGALDTWVREAVAAHVTPLVMLTGAPAWAEGRGRRRSAPAGTWKPSAADYRLFAEALARRYSGGFANLPRVRYYQAWNEPNLWNFLNPQWTRHGGRFQPASPAIYRRLLNAFYKGAKRGYKRAYIVSAGTAPFGESQPGGKRMQAAFFTRELLCVRGRSHPRPKRRCPGGPVFFNALAHHPYPIGTPLRTAINPDDVVIPDIWKLTRPMKVALRAGYVRPRQPKPVWATEISWDTSPPDPNGLPAKQVARYTEGALYTLWRQGVSVVAWWLMRDEPEGQGWGYTLQSGVFFRGPSVAADRPKPGFYTFRFPFTAYTKRGVAQIWGLAPKRGAVTIEVRRGGRWRTLMRLRTRQGRMFFTPKRLDPGTPLRARQGPGTSLAWRVGPNFTR
jgi:hypothetical protein